ncbi:biopolymer transporter ExbD [Selenomonas sputigena]|uniref:Biopolymer transporter ExbD n=1 Tax=Selenomonas sputigena TaxID=69823 RepID=A0ABV3X1T9_9FIRM
MNFSKHRMRKKPVFMIIPMIDIIFFLLVFFMMNSLQTVAQKALAVQLPQAQSASAPVQMPIIMTLDEKGHITVDNKPVSLQDASVIMKRHMQENANAAVVLQADRKTAHGQVVAVMDMLKGAGVKRLSIAAEQKK